MPIRGVLFDVDDTLCDYSTSEEVGLLTHLESEGLLDLFPAPSAAVALWRTITEAEYARFLMGELTFTGQQRARTRRFLSHIGHARAAAMSDQDVSEWFAGYEAQRNAAWSAFTDAEPTLRKLAPSYRLGVVSNSSVDHQRRKLNATGLLAYFGEALICSDQHGAAKPSPSIFLAGCTSLGLRPGEVAYVGDRYAVDAVGAYDAGLRAYWLDRANLSSHMPIEDRIHVIGSLDELPAALIG